MEVGVFPRAPIDCVCAVLVARLPKAPVDWGRVVEVMVVEFVFDVVPKLNGLDVVAG